MQFAADDIDNCLPGAERTRTGVRVECAMRKVEQSQHAVARPAHRDKITHKRSA